MEVTESLKFVVWTQLFIELTIAQYNRGMFSAEITTLLQTIAAASPAPIYLVGGIVRDTLLGQTTADHDLDLITKADAPTVVAALISQLGGTQTTHSRFATATWHLPPDLATTIAHIDFATTRTETYATPAQLPTVTASTIAHDLARRDFTINAMALPLSGGDLIDPHNGQADLANGILRTLHPASFRDDPTRLQRGIRFEQRFGFSFAPETQNEWQTGLNHIHLLTGPRIWNEFEKTFAEPDPAAVMARMAELGVLEKIESGLGWDAVSAETYKIYSQLQSNPTWVGLRPTPAPTDIHAILWLHPHPVAVQRATINRLHLNTIIAQTLTDLRELTSSISNLQQRPKLVEGSPILPSTIDTLLTPYAKRPATLLSLRCLISNHALSLSKGSPFPIPHSQFDLWQSTDRHLRLTVDGNTLRQLGLPPGPLYRTILATVRAHRLDGLIDADGELPLLQSLAAPYI